LGFLLSIYDEYVSGYKDRRAAGKDEISAGLKALGNALTHIMILSDQIVGSWKPEVEKDTVVVRANPLVALSAAEKKALSGAAAKYSEFFGLKARLVMELSDRQSIP
jgi:hypothetical protein